MPASDMCERCGQRPGIPYRLHYGRLASTSTQLVPDRMTRGVAYQETQKYVIDGTQQISVCTACVEEALRSEVRSTGRWAVFWGVIAAGSFAFFVAPAIPTFVQGQTFHDLGGYVFFLLLAVGIPLGAALALLVKVRRFVTADAAGRAQMATKRHLGENLAIKIIGPRLRERYGSTEYRVWTPEAFKELKKLD